MAILWHWKWVLLNFRYSPDELRYLPLNTALYEPPLDPELPALDSDGDSDDVEERGDEKHKIKGNSVSLNLYFGKRIILPPTTITFLDGWQSVVAIVLI